MDDGMDRFISLRLLPEEAEILTAKAEEAGMSRSGFLKNVILFGAAHERRNFASQDR